MRLFKYLTTITTVALLASGCGSQADSTAPTTATPGTADQVAQASCSSVASAQFAKLSHDDYDSALDYYTSEARRDVIDDIVTCVGRELVAKMAAGEIPFFFNDLEPDPNGWTWVQSDEGFKPRSVEMLVKLKDGKLDPSVKPKNFGVGETFEPSRNIGVEPKLRLFVDVRADFAYGDDGFFGNAPDSYGWSVSQRFEDSTLLPNQLGESISLLDMRINNAADEAGYFEFDSRPINRSDPSLKVEVIRNGGDPIDIDAGVAILMDQKLTEWLAYTGN